MNKKTITPLLLILLLLILAACGGATDEASAPQEAPSEAVESEAETTTEEEAPAEAVESEDEALEEEAPAEEEAIEDPPMATGSEDDSSPFPPPINSGSKVDGNNQGEATVASLDILLIGTLDENTAVSMEDLQTNWEETKQQIEALPGQPQVRYATIFLENDDLQQLTLTAFADDIDWTTMTEGSTTVSPINEITNFATNLDWQADGALELVLLLVDPTSFEIQDFVFSETAVYFPLITPEMNTTEAMILDIEAEMEDVNGRLIQIEDENQTTLSEQIIVAIAETINNPNE